MIGVLEAKYPFLHGAVEVVGALDLRLEELAGLSGVVDRGFERV